MKKILFVITNLRHGGTNKSLQNLISLINKEEYKIDVLALEYYGPYKTMFNEAKLLKKDIWIHSIIGKFEDLENIDKLTGLLLKILRKATSYINFDFTNFLFKNTVKKLEKDDDYDIIIAYSEGTPTHFVSNFTREKKIAWIHCDYSSYLKLNNYPDEKYLYEKYNSIVCVSHYTKDVFCKIMPSLCNRVYAIHNTLNVSMIKSSSELKIKDTYFDKELFNIISVGRMCSIKRFSLIPDIVFSLKNKGHKFKWYIIGGNGDKGEYNLIISKIKKLEIDNELILLDEKDNPYPYIKNSDLLVSTSSTEACPLVVAEAKILGNPVICADYPSAKEFIQTGYNGYISKIEDIPTVISSIIGTKEKYNFLKSNLKDYQYENNNILNKIYKLF